MIGAECSPVSELHIDPDAGGERYGPGRNVGSAFERVAISCYAFVSERLRLKGVKTGEPRYITLNVGLLRDRFRTMKQHSTIVSLLVLMAASALLTSCQQYRNFTTYYNRFWNMERIMAEVEDEVEYFRSKQDPPKPQYHVPYDEPSGDNFYSEHLQRRTLEPEEVKANKIKLDSILLKGSLLLTRQSESDYVDDAVFYICKAYFYMREWYQSQQKAIELIENFPDSKWQPDAHLLLAMDLLKMGEVEAAEKMLSKTVDVAFKFKRQDVLTEAFRLNADAQLALGKTDQAVKPYERAILLSDDDEEQARWQYEIGVVYFRAGRFEKAVEAFDEVDNYDPSDLTKFEAGLQKAVSLRVLKKYDEADAQLNALRDEDDFKEWAGVVEAERLSLKTDRAGATQFSPDQLAAVDSLGGKDYALYGVYERGVRAFRAGDYQMALANFTIVQSSTAPFQTKSRHYSIWINYYNEQYFQAAQATRFNVTPFPDSLAQRAADRYYNVARFFTRFNVDDSTEIYYRKSLEWAPDGSVEGARSLYALSSFLRQRGNGVEADSLLDVLATQYGKSEYAREARKRLGYDESYVIDDAYDLYLFGRSSMLNANNYSRALSQFSELVATYPASEYAPQALYASGLIYERYLNNPDSALYYYSQLIERYPESEQAKAVKSLVDATIAAREGGGEGEGEGLVRLADAEDPIVDPVEEPKDEDAAEVGPPWFDDSLYEPIPALAMDRRGKRTLDIQ